MNGVFLPVVTTYALVGGEYDGKMFDELARNGDRVFGRVEGNGLKWLTGRVS